MGCLAPTRKCKKCGKTPITDARRCLCSECLAKGLRPRKKPRVEVDHDVLEDKVETFVFDGFVPGAHVPERSKPPLRPSEPVVEPVAADPFEARMVEYRQSDHYRGWRAAVDRRDPKQTLRRLTVAPKNDLPQPRLRHRAYTQEEWLVLMRYVCATRERWCGYEVWFVPNFVAAVPIPAALARTYALDRRVVLLSGARSTGHTPRHLLIFDSPEEAVCVECMDALRDELFLL